MRKNTRIKLKHHHDKENDILMVVWSDSEKQEVDYSEEMTTSEGHDFVIDYDKKGRIVAIEIFNWNRGRKKK